MLSPGQSHILAECRNHHTCDMFQYCLVIVHLLFQYNLARMGLLADCLKWVFNVISVVEIDFSYLPLYKFYDVELFLFQLDIQTKLCIRDSLYRLARSAEQRHRHANLNIVSGDDGGTSGPLVTEGTNKYGFVFNIYIYMHWFLHSLLSWLSHITPILLFALLISQLVFVYIVDRLLNLHHC